MLSKFNRLLNQKSVKALSGHFISSSSTNNSCSSGKYTFPPAPKKRSPVWSWNEWDRLEEVILGVPHLGVVPYPYPETAACFGPRLTDDFMTKYGGQYWSEVMPIEVWQKVLEEHKELVTIFKGEGVTVKHPTPIDMKVKYSTPYFEGCGLDVAFPRDIILVIGDEIMDTTMTWRSRFFEYMAYRPIMLEYFRQGADMQSAPKPELSEKSFKQNFDISGAQFDKLGYVTTEYEPLFDAADFMRCGRDFFVQQSHVTNLTGIEWMRQKLAEKGVRLHVLDFKDPYAMHIDATFFPVKPGVLFENPEVTNPYKEHMEKAGWKVYKGAQPAPRNDLFEGMCYKWLSMNVLVLDQDRVLVEAREEGMQKLFESVGMKPIKVNFSHCFSVGGGLHCWTSDVRRAGTLENYFDWSEEILEKTHVDICS